MTTLPYSPRAARLRRLRRGAEAVLERYGLSDARLTFIAHSENATYRVDHADSRYLLRLHVPHHPGAICAGTQRPEVISSELSWLTALRDDLQLPVPEPVADQQGRWVNEVAAEGETHPVSVTLTRWVAGRFPHSLTLEQCRTAGALMARLHDHAAGWQPPEGFQRPAWDWPNFENSLAEMEALLRLAPPYLRLTGEQVAVFRRCADRIRETTQPLGTGRKAWGLIHADLHPGNLLFHQGEARAIDFSRCGWGHFLYDMAECCRFLGPEKRRAFAEGYGRHRPLPVDYPELLEAFFVRGWIENFAFHSPNPKEQEWLSQAVPPFVERLEATYLRGEVFLTR